MPTAAPTKATPKKATASAHYPKSADRSSPPSKPYVFDEGLSPLEVDQPKSAKRSKPRSLSR